MLLGLIKSPQWLGIFPMPEQHSGSCCQMACEALATESIVAEVKKLCSGETGAIDRDQGHGQRTPSPQSLSGGMWKESGRLLGTDAEDGALTEDCAGLGLRCCESPFVELRPFSSGWKTSEGERGMALALLGI